MKLQRILAKDSRSANEQAIAKYGRDVLVVSNSRVNGMTELIVAVDVEPEKMPPPQMPRAGGEQFENALRQQRLATESTTPPAGSTDPSAARTSSGSAASSSTALPEAFVPAHMALMQAAQRAAAQSMGQTEPLRPVETAEAGDPPRPVAPKAPTTRAPSVASAPLLRYGQQFSLNASAVMPLPQMILVPQLQSVVTANAAVSAAEVHTAPARAEVIEEAIEAVPTTAAMTSDKAHALTELIRAEIAQLRKEMRMGQQLQAWAAQGPSHRWNEALTEVGVPTALRALLMSGLSNDFDDDQALAAIEEQMSENLPHGVGNRHRRRAPQPWTTGVHLLSGPSGSGKTSMAARLAQDASQRLGTERVVLVSWNDNRPGAWGQLQLWASRIGVAAFRATDSGTLDLLLQEHRGSLIIVDSGLSQPDILNAAVQGLQATHHLVMPADANAATLRRWLGEASPAWADVIVTRLDESAQPWPLLQACCEHQISPTIASDGSGLNHLRQPYDAQALLQHGMSVLSAALGSPHGEQGNRYGGAMGLDIPTIERITTTVPPRQAGRSGRGASAAKTCAALVESVSTTPARSASKGHTKNATATTRSRQGASHA